jgi:acylphosphatase
VIHGLVQGVFFRESTRQLAQAAGVTGWVRNLPDGQVEAVIEGPPHPVAEVIAFCHEGPVGARVDQVEVFDEPPEGLATFTVRLTPPR